MNTYTRGNIVKVTVTVTDSSVPTPQLVDPTQVLAEFYGGDGTLHLPTVTRASTGVYSYLIDSSLLPVATRQVCYRRAYAPDGDPAQFACEGQMLVVTPGQFSP